MPGAFLRPFGKARIIEPKNPRKRRNIPCLLSKWLKSFPEQVDELAALAKPIWTDHFTPIIGAEQTAYMIEKFQSAPAMRAQMANEGYHYYFFLYDGQKAGYTGIRRDGDSLFLSKIYVEKSFRRKGIASPRHRLYDRPLPPRGIAENLAHGQ